VSARKTFDAIIIDSPPVLLVADAGVISREVDGTLLVARLNHTDRSAFGLAAANLMDLDVPLAGLIVTCAEVPSGYGYYLGADSYSSTARSNGRPGVGRPAEPCVRWQALVTEDAQLLH